MSIRKLPNGYQWGNTGTVFPRYEQALAQGRAIQMNRQSYMNLQGKASYAQALAGPQQTNPKEAQDLHDQAEESLQDYTPVKITIPKKPIEIDYGGQAGKLKTKARLSLRPITATTTPQARGKGLSRRLRTRIHLNFVEQDPSVSGYFFRPYNKKTSPRIELFTRLPRTTKKITANTLNKLKSNIRRSLVHELTHLRDYARTGSTNGLMGETRAYSYQHLA